MGGIVPFILCKSPLRVYSRARSTLRETPADYTHINERRDAMRVSGWLYLIQQTLFSLMMILGTARLSGVRISAAKSGLTTLGCGLICLIQALSGQAWLQIPMLGSVCVMIALAARRPAAARAALVLSLTAAGLIRLACSMGMPPALLPLLAAAVLFLRPGESAAPAYIRLSIRCGASRMTLSALVDTGNLLRDPLTDLPVIVCARKAAAPLCPDALREAYPPGLRLLSVRTVAGSALMPVFRPDSLFIRQDHAWREIKAVVGLAPLDYHGCQAIMPAGLMAYPTQGGAL